MFLLFVMENVIIMENALPQILAHVSEGKWELNVKLIVDVEDMVLVMLMLLANVMKDLFLIQLLKNVSFNVLDK